MQFQKPSNDTGSSSYSKTHEGGLFTDLYQFTMAQAYLKNDMAEPAVFDLYIRTLPHHRNYSISCGLYLAMKALESFRFSEEDLQYLATRPELEATFIDYLADFSFTGRVRAIPEGTPVFPGEPLLEVQAPLPQAQLVETVLLNQMNASTIWASKASRVVQASGEEATVVDFGMRRTHGRDAALNAARAFYIAGVDATSNVEAGRTFGIPITGTMAHSYVQAHESEAEAFRQFSEQYPETVLLVDTYDTTAGVRRVVRLADELGKDFQVRGIRLDSGDLGSLARKTRAILDDAGLTNLAIFVSGGLDEGSIRDLVTRNEAPIDGFGVGTKMGVSEDAPALDSVYKLVSYDGKGRMKLSAGKATLPGRKQIWRQSENGTAERDVIGLAYEVRAGRSLLKTVMKGGTLLDHQLSDLEESRRRASRLRDRLPGRIRALDPAEPPYRVETTESLAGERDRARHRINSNN